MTKELALKIVLGIGLAGMIFSGYLSYQELIAIKNVGCPAVGDTGTILGYPACVYGFLMYGIVTIVAGLGLTSKK